MPCSTIDQFIGCFFVRPPAPFGLPDQIGDPARQGVIYRGSAGFGDSYTVASMLPPGFEEVPAFSNGFRVVWVNQNARAILTYCEGDLDLTIDRSPDLFQARFASAAAYYRTMA